MNHNKKDFRFIHLKDKQKIIKIIQYMYTHGNNKPLANKCISTVIIRKFSINFLNVSKTTIFFKKISYIPIVKYVIQK